MLCAQCPHLIGRALQRKEIINVPAWNYEHLKKNGGGGKITQRTNAGLITNELLFSEIVGNLFFFLLKKFKQSISYVLQQHDFPLVIVYS